MLNGENSIAQTQSFIWIDLFHDLITLQNVNGGVSTWPFQLYLF